MPIARLAMALATMLALPGLASAHFPWLTVDQDNHALLFFSEGVLERDYHVPECVEQAEVHAVDPSGKARPVKMAASELEGFQGLRSVDPVQGDDVLTTAIQYGVYHGTMLRYYAKHSPLQQQTKPTKEGLALDADLTPVQDGIKLRITWMGQPLVGAEVAMTDSQGQQTTSKTNKRGIATFRSLAGGEVGFLVGNTLQDMPGEFEGEKYGSQTHYLSVTTRYGAPTESSEKNMTSLPELPAPIASFGAAVADGWLYVYSGHTGEAHQHTRENLSPHFCRLKLDGGESWESLPMQTPLQGLALVAHGGKLYRVGGLNHRNAADEEEDMHSTDEFACFDPATKTWTALPKLPSPRSSHDAVVIGDMLYVVGGWQLSGSGPGEWQQQAIAIDLADPEKGWRAVSKAPFLRRALAAAQLDSKLVVLGGMQDDQGVTNKVASYDPQADSWSDLPALPPSGSGGFGVSAWNLNGVLYACGMNGTIYALAPGAEAWAEAAEVDDPRFFHRLLPAAPDALLVVAGASTENGHVGTVEVVELPQD